MSTWDVIGIGALNWDIIYELPNLNILDELDISISPGREIHLEGVILKPLLILLERYGKKKAESGGGQAANTAYALARMGFKTKVIGKTGNDRWGDLILQCLSGVDTTGVAREGESGICISILTPDEERSLIVFPNVNDNMDIREPDMESLCGSRFLHLTSFSGQSPLHAQIGLLKKMGKNSPFISFDPGNLYARLGMDSLLPILERAFCLFATESELEMITCLTGEEAVLRILETGIRMVICKQGARGAYLMDHRKRRWDFPPLKVDIKDSTGAGDCFAAGFIAGILKGKDIETCGRLGTLAAASCIKGYGRESYPDEDIFVQ
ncbi:carbohydrate kinase family protein [bacterium]|nr:carbohydrate kinase family protein [bacterium]